jgi:hypothetical protein
MKKKLILLASGILLAGVLSWSTVLFLKKILTSNKNRFIKMLANILAEPLKKKDVERINNILEMIIKLPSVKEIIVVTKDDIFDRSKESSLDISYLVTENVIYKNKTIGNLKVYFI